MKVVIDRIEEGFAVCETEKRVMVNFAVEMLPKGIEEGMVLDVEGESIIIDKEETEKRKKMAEKMLEDIFKHRI